MSNFTAAKKGILIMIKLVKIFFMTKIINEENKNEPWLNWLTRELNSYEAFKDFASGKEPEDVLKISYMLIGLPYQKFSRDLMRKIK